MTNEEQYEELLRLIAGLAQRVHKLEQMAGLRQAPPPLEPLPPARATPRRSDEAELESRIGGHWLNRAGIVSVLIGVSYFLKYAFDNEWIGPATRVLIGLMAGLGVVFWGDRVRRRGYLIFSYSLTAVGIGVLYLSLWACSQLYHLVPNTLAFLAMTSVTAATVGLALWQDAEVMAAFAAVGAFITPVALSTGENNATSLFTYVAIFDVAAIVLARYRPWIRVLIGSYAGTVLLYSAWHSRFYTPDQFSTALVSVSVLFAVFALTPFLDQRDRNARAVVFLALVNAATYFFEVWELFEHSAETRQAAIAAVSLGCVYFLIAGRLTNRSPGVTGQVHWAIGAALLVAAVPIGLNAQWITIGWFVETGALIRVSRKTQNAYLKHLGGLALVLGVFRLLFIDDFDVTRLLFNERMMTFAVAVAVLAYVAGNLAGSGRKDERAALAVLTVTINVVALVALTGEITDVWRRQVQASGPAGSRNFGIIRDFAYSALWMSYGAGVMLVGFWKQSRFLRWQALVLIALTTAKVFLYDTSSLDRGYRILSLIALGLILLTTSFLYQRNWFKLEQR